MIASPAVTSARLAWGVVAAAAAAAVYGLARYWLVDYTNADRLLILPAAAYVASLLWPTLPAPRPCPALGLFVLVVAAALFLPPWYVATQTGARPIVIWWMSVPVLLAAAGLLLVERGFGAVRHLRFPLLVPLLALPLPGRVINPLQAELQHWTTTLAEAALSALGYVVRRDGFTLSLPSGGLEVVEACSGVKSLTALLAVACFAAHYREFRLGRGVLTIVLTIPVVVLANALRVTLTGVIQENFGGEAIKGWRHDALGLGVVLVGVALIVGITALLAIRSPSPPGSAGGEGPGVRGDGGPSPEDGVAAAKTPSPLTPLPPKAGGEGDRASQSRGERGTRIAAALLLAAFAGGVYLDTLPSLVRSAADPPLTDIPKRLGAWKCPDEDKPFPPEIREPLGCDAGLYRVYTRLGLEAHVWVMHWRSANGVRDYHHPDVCWPSRGFVLTAKAVEPVHTPVGRTVPLTYREFARGATERQLVVYWTQEGRRVWSDADEADAVSPLFPLKWIRKRLTRGDHAGDTDDRVVVLVGMPTYEGSKFGRAELLELTGKLADEVYGVCPWADPSAGK